MAKKYLDDNGVLYFWQKIRNTFVSNITYDSSTRKIQQKKKTGTSGAEAATDIVTLSTVATSGSYNDLSNKPTIPSAGTGTSYPAMDGTRALGTNAGYARVDHVHPSDTTKVDKVSGKGLSTNDYTTTEKNKLSGIEAGAQVNVQADWNEDDISSDAYINNKPELAAVATSGSYNDLSNKPTIPSLKNVFGIVKVGSTSVEADTTRDTLELAGSNVTLTPDATNDKVTIGITASNVTTALGNTAVARATADASGNTITSTYAPKASPALTGTPTAPTATAGTNTTQIATTAFVKNAVDTAIVGAAAFQGTAPTSFAPTNYKKGWYWVIGTAGTYVGQTCEVGDMIFCIKDYASAYAASDFDVIQTNLDITSITNAEIDTIVAA